MIPDPTETERDRYDEVKRLFQAALDLPRDQRDAFVAERAEGDAELLEEVRVLLRAHLSSQPTGTHDSSGAEDGTNLVVPQLQSVGPYRVEREIGQGGMGRVFRATREQPRRAVALKLMNRALHDATAVRRFEYESQVLAHLNHPNIAHVYESGTVELVGQTIPWYAMELIEGGRSLADVLGADKPARSDRLELFLQICDGVHHAHQKGVIHRDLKPGNVLVDPGERVKLIDFGVAKPVTPDVVGASALSTLGQIVGTLAYMSPEQTSGPSTTIDVRADVYALGVILYELCADQPPYAIDRDNIRAAVQTVCETAPASEPLEAAKVPADLRIIIHKALAKDPEQRFASAAALGDDIRRFLGGEPIDARPPSVLYQLQRFAARNRGLVLAVAALFVTLAVGASVSTWGLIEARRAQASAEQARDSAESERERAAQAEQDAVWSRNFATEILYSADPWQSGETDVTVRELLDRASERLDNAADADVHTRVRARQTLAEVYTHLEAHAEAERETRRALAVTDGRDDLADARLELLNRLAGTLQVTDRLDEAAAIVAETLEDHRARYGDDDPRTWAAEQLEADLVATRGELNEARAIMTRLAERRAEHYGPEADETLETRASLARVLYGLEDRSQAEAEFRWLWQARQRTLGPAHPNTLRAEQDLIGLIVDTGRLEQAEALLSAHIETATRELGADHGVTIMAMVRQAIVLRRLGRPNEAVSLARRILERSRTVHGATHINTLRGENNLAMTLVDAREHEEAERIYLDLMARWRDRDPDGEASYLVVAINYATMLRGLDRGREAIPIVEEFLTRARREYPPEFWLLAEATKLLGVLSKEAD